MGIVISRGIVVSIGYLKWELYSYVFFVSPGEELGKMTPDAEMLKLFVLNFLFVYFFYYVFPIVIIGCA